MFEDLAIEENLGNLFSFRSTFVASRMESGSVLKGLFYGGFASCVAETCECPIASNPVKISPLQPSHMYPRPSWPPCDINVQCPLPLSLSHVPSSCL